MKKHGLGKVSNCNDFQGTGKTTVARKFGQFYYQLGILSTTELIDCSASDFIGQFVGQTGPKTKKMLKSALGKVLFVDEAYRFCDGGFGKEAINELVDSLTRTEYMSKVVVILAGYNDDMDRLLRINPGLSSRFPEEIPFHNMKPHDCLLLLKDNIRKSGVEVTPMLQEKGSEQYLSVIKSLTELSKLSTWGNGRDIKTLAKTISSAVLANTSPEAATLTATAEDILQALESMLSAQTARSKVPETASASSSNLGPSDESKEVIAILPPSDAPPPTIQPLTLTSVTSVASVIAEANQTESQPESNAIAIEQALPLTHEETPIPPQREPDVSDETWQRLQSSIAAREAKRVTTQNSRAAHEEAIRESQAREDNALAGVKQLKTLQQQTQLLQRVQELEQQIEAERQVAEAAAKERSEAEERLRYEFEEAERLIQREEAVQQRIREKGVCPAGFSWLKEEDGYRCYGGSHFLTNGEIGL